MGDPSRTILIVDDEPGNIELLKGVIPSGFKIKVAISGEKAISIVLKPPCPDLIFLDVMMPGIDGYEVCRRLKADPATAAVPIVFVSGLANDTERQKGLALGAEDFIAKPIDPHYVQALVQRFCGP
jgi:CheY-like chemotaxis protein